MSNRVMKNEKESDVKFIKKVTTAKPAKASAEASKNLETSSAKTAAKVYGSPCLPQYSD